MHSKTQSHSNLQEPGAPSATINGEGNESLIRHHLHNMLWLCELLFLPVVKKMAENKAFGHILRVCVTVCAHPSLYSMLTGSELLYAVIYWLSSHLLRRTRYMSKAAYGLYLKQRVSRIPTCSHR